MTFVDTVMSGRLSAEALASVAAGAALWHTILLAGMGVLMAVSAFVAQYDGARQYERIGPLVRQALWVALGLTLLTAALYSVAEPLLVGLDIDASLHETILGYLRALLWGAPAMYAFFALRFLCEGMGLSRPVMYFGFVGLAVNVVANYGLIYGRWGLPALGAVGCGFATSAVWTVQLVGLILYIRRHERLAPLAVFARFDGAELGRAASLAGRGGADRFQLLRRGEHVRRGRAAHGLHRRGRRGGAPGGDQRRVDHVHGAARDLAGDDRSGRQRVRARRYGGNAPLRMDRGALGARSPDRVGHAAVDPAASRSPPSTRGTKGSS